MGVLWPCWDGWRDVGTIPATGPRRANRPRCGAVRRAWCLRNFIGVGAGRVRRGMSDGDAANGCETASVATCEAAEALCGETCVVLEELHWSGCGTCAAGYVDSDGDAANGCETPVFSNGDCQTDHDCKGLMHVSAATCESGRCVIASCADGYADCDGAVESGCEVLGKRDFNHCGAQGLCNVGERDSGNFAGMTCLLGQQCLDGACVAVPEIVGCSDGTREGFRDLIRFNNLAACGGAWTVPGIHHNEGPVSASPAIRGRIAMAPDAMWKIYVRRAGMSVLAKVMS